MEAAWRAAMLLLLLALSAAAEAAEPGNGTSPMAEPAPSSSGPLGAVAEQCLTGAAAFLANLNER